MNPVLKQRQDADGEYDDEPGRMSRRARDGPWRPPMRDSVRSNSPRILRIVRRDPRAARSRAIAYGQ